MAFDVMIKIPIQYPNGDVKYATGYRNLGFQRECQARDPDLGVTDIQMTFATLGTDEDIRETMRTKRRPGQRTGAFQPLITTLYVYNTGLETVGQHNALFFLQ